MTTTRTEPWYVAALELVKKNKAGKRDQLDRPYHEHFERVTDHLLVRFPRATPAQVQTALLHDAFEPDVNIDEATLRAHGVFDEAIAMIRRLTLPTDGRSYLQYIADLCASGDRAAMEVKLADNTDAFDLLRAIGTPEMLEMLETTYKPSRAMLEQALR